MVDMVGDVVVIGQRDDGLFYMWVARTQYYYIIERPIYDGIRNNPGNNIVIEGPGPDDVQEFLLDIVTNMLDLIKKMPGLTPEEIQDITLFVNTVEALKISWENGDLTKKQLNDAIEGGLEILFDQGSSYVGSLVAGAIFASAGAAGGGTAAGGPGALVFAGLGAVGGAALAQLMPSEQLASFFADVITGDANIDFVERAVGSLRDFANMAYREYQSWLFSNAPAGPTLPSNFDLLAAAPQFAQSFYGSTNTTALSDGGVQVFSGDAKGNRAAFGAAGSAVYLDMAVAGAQNTGGAGWVSLKSIEDILGSAHNDTLLGNMSDNAIAGGLGDDVIDGRGGFDFADYRTSSSGVTVSLYYGTASGGGGNDTLSNIEGVMGSHFDDTLIGDFGANTLYGGRGVNQLYGLGGDDILYANGLGGAGTLGNNSFYGGTEFDIVSYEDFTVGLTVYLLAPHEYGGIYGLGRAFVTASGIQSSGDLLGEIEGAWLGSGNDIGYGTDSANEFHGYKGNDRLYGYGGDDLLEGGDGDDDLYGGAGIDTASYTGATSGVTVRLDTTARQVTGGAGSDILVEIENITGSNFDDTLTGNSGANRLAGALGRDTINGGAGNDTIIGGYGADTLTGGLGADAFVYYRADESDIRQADVITDFQVGVDKLNFSAMRQGSADSIAFAVRNGSTFVEIDLGGDGSIDAMVELRGVLAGAGFTDVIW